MTTEVRASAKPVLLATKLYVPRPRPNRVERESLLRRLDRGLTQGRPLTLVSAPAGFGKTTLVSDWCDRLSTRHSVAWLSLGPQDNDPVCFWTYVIAALQTAEPGLASTVVEHLHSPQPPPALVVAGNLLNALATSDKPMILVLDDYHEISVSAVHESLAILLEQAPPNLHLVLLTRTDPPLPVAALRAKGRVTELRARDLCFGDAEALAFCNDTMRLELPSEAVRALTKRTEGWVAGLQLAALSLQGRPEVATAGATFTGSHRYVVDYLVEEVLVRQSPTTQDFLLRTSVLRTMCASLCDAVTGFGDGQERLEALEAAQLFVVALDDERRWYRYHPLFAEFLRSRLTRRLPEAEPELHR